MLEALGSRGRYAPIEREEIADIRGVPRAELGLVPELFVTRTLAETGTAPARSIEERSKLLAAAGDLFADGTVAGVSAAEYRAAVTAVSGLPVTVVESAARVIGEAARRAVDTAYAAMPARAEAVWTDVAGGRAVWARRGRSLAVNAAGNHPGVHSLWLEAVALGYGVAVRPSRREPFTPHRLVAALWEVGFTGPEIALLPGTQRIVTPLLAAADLGLVYGGDDVVARYRDDPRVLPQGPGRSKIVLTGDISDRHIESAVDSIAHQGGTACVNATAVFVDGDHRAVAERIAERLAALPALPPEDRAAVLPCGTEASARAVAGAVARVARGAHAVLPAEDMVVPFGDGSAALRPTLYTCDRSDAPQAGAEMPYPCAWVLPWSPGELSVLRDSLVLTAFTDDDDFVTALVDDVSIRNVYVGDVPTYWMDFGVPHDGFLGEFLMRSTAVVRRPDPAQN
ncbi:aldehyde dehydrogenase family protein [Nocardia arizonensis]|uniref:aldehyde dehydrogenase family protein n=1 Tax=Nocardia arizonensis TaxID=1141647 RepID=UPI0006D1D2E7|nr:aldehyde dehydrogenase family protein [Nocardia arizonensis]